MLPTNTKQIPAAELCAALGGYSSVSRLRILGVEFDQLSFADAVEMLRAAACHPRRLTVYFANAHTLDLARRSRTYRRILNEADVVFGDGTGIRWAARLQGIRLRANLNGTDLIPAFLQAANGDGLRCYLLGATPEVVTRAAEVVRRRFPGWTIAGFHHGFLEVSETERVIAAINEAQADLLLVGMGNPLQEQWIAAHRARLSANLVVGVGGLFSYLSGDYRRAPLALRRNGLEWLSVLFTQRQKWRRYLIGAPVFLMFAAAERLFGERV